MAKARKKRATKAVKREAAALKHIADKAAHDMKKMADQCKADIKGMQRWVCEAPVRTGCGGGARGGHVLGDRSSTRAVRYR